MTKIYRKLSVALVTTVSLSVAFLTSAHARPMIAELKVEDVEFEVEEVSSVDGAPVCKSEDSVIDGLLGTLSDDELESLFQQNNPKFADAFNSCVDEGGETNACEDEAMQLALLGDEKEFVSFQEPQPKRPTAKTPEQIRDELRKAMREHVFLMVNLYWMEHDMKMYGYWDQDGDGIADRLDRDSYNGHGIKKAYPRPVPGARADGHYNCEYFAQYFRQAFVAVFYNRSKKNMCWKLEYQVHATVAFYYYYKGHDIYVFVEPQGGSSWFISTPTLPIGQMPGRGQTGVVNGIQCHNLDENSWTGVFRPNGPNPPLPQKVWDSLIGKDPIDDMFKIKPGMIDGLPLPPEKIKELRDLLLKPQDLKTR